MFSRGPYIINIRVYVIWQFNYETDVGFGWIPNYCARLNLTMPSSSSSSLRHRFIPVQAANVLLFLIGFRLVNALTVRTFFQPDEFFQSLEPAWQVAFGKNQGTWITWVSGAMTTSRNTGADNGIGMAAPTSILTTSPPLRRNI